MSDRERLIKLFKKIEYTPFPEMTLKSNLGNQFTDYALNYIVDKFLANGVTVNEWRPASEPPKECGEYNVMILGAETPTTLFYSKVHNGWYEFNDDEYDIPYNVTHWMPLPEAPKGVE